MSIDQDYGGSVAARLDWLPSDGDSVMDERHRKILGLVRVQALEASVDCLASIGRGTLVFRPCDPRNADAIAIVGKEEHL